MQARKILEISCKYCDKKIAAPKRKFCSSSCKNKYNHKYLYKWKYQKRHNNASIENYLNSLLYKKTRKAITKEDLLALWVKQEGKCAISGVIMTHLHNSGKVPTNVSIDKIDCTKEYTVDNIQLLCCVVNTMKWTMTKEQLVSWCKIIVHNND